MRSSTLVVLVRHAECQKTRLGYFGNPAGKDALTPAGLRRATLIGRALERHARLKDLDVDLYCASSERARCTAEVIGRAVARVPMVLDLTSIDLGPISGLTSKELLERFPHFAQSLSLYRAGLFNSYDLPFPNAAESPKRFERQTFRRFLDVVCNSKSDLLIFVLHRSPMTAILISIARQMKVYPHNFYGVVPISPGDCFLIGRRGKILKIKSPNVSPQNLHTVLRSLLK